MERVPEAAFTLACQHVSASASHASAALVRLSRIPPASVFGAAVSRKSAESLLMNFFASGPICRKIY
ncbi:hypothetical protein [Nocardia nova]|uniref:hypothetical protein n=1 Tax=Nocardia nova TaxID=37330 RepID=UPI0018939DE6|nr:hypothetical protein [Nocardia nova]MBF6146341.1 hypothetical protein [Nocardia nova]MDN2497590.1 hypothetical protein [Nocardia nova]